MYIAKFVETELTSDERVLNSLGAFKTRSGSLSTLLLSLHSHSLELIITLVDYFGAALELSALEIAHCVKRSISLDQTDITEFLLKHFAYQHALEQHAVLLLDEAVAHSNLHIVCQILEMFEFIETKALVNVLKYVNLRLNIMQTKCTLVDRVFKLVFDKFKVDLADKLPNKKSLFALCFEFDNQSIYRLLT